MYEVIFSRENKFTCKVFDRNHNSMYCLHYLKQTPKDVLYVVSFLEITCTEIGDLVSIETVCCVRVEVKQIRLSTTGSKR